MKQTTAILATALAVVAGGPPLGGAGESAAIERPADLALAGAAPSIEKLLDRFLRALAARDGEALRRLRVTEREYRTVIIPGSAPVGQPPQVYSEENGKFLWGLHETKSHYVTADLLARFGGRALRLKGVRYRKGTRRYAWFTAHRRAELRLEDERGKEVLIALGSIVEIDGRYKFVGFQRG
jgi:hypothetical protein